ncbi:CIA30 family protein [Marimonas arenosa]|uniref:CIA30 family protein n=1 Tax=Marimonas arenosa TaxID=1795305 RepID=A0AAE3WEP3_9RHOB|nr:CIA30 family protein [Marimonas arenosa]MDQ2090990.1 CIA30 family protein [Marimonas arenosa]
MQTKLGVVAGFCAVMLAAPSARGQDRMIEDFTGSPGDRWEYISDQVMGGVSSGRVSLQRDGGQVFLRLQGEVSTANNGGFIQARLKLSERLPNTAQGLELKVRGNGQTYYVHARTGGTVLPWTFYQASFEVTPRWATVRIPFEAFQARGRMLRKTLAPEAIRSLAVVAYGRDHTADLSVADIRIY